MQMYRRLEELLGQDGTGGLAETAERELIPLPVLVSLQAGIPILYDRERRRFAFADPERGLRFGRRPIASAADGDRLWRFDQTIYPAADALAAKVYTAAAGLLAELNVFYTDDDGGVVGHLSCLPLRVEAYEALRCGEVHEGGLRVDDLALSGHLYICSMYAAHRAVGKTLFADIGGFLDRFDGVCGAFAVTESGLRACGRLGLRVVREDREEWERTRTEIVPVFLERRGNRSS